MTGKQLNAHNAVIKTATVEIKALTVSGRQVTQSVFRQLREEPLIAEDGTLNGVPWGYVNYHPDKCESPREEFQHWHIVWQRGEDLLRSRVLHKITFKTFDCAEADDRLNAWIYNWALGKLNSPLSDRTSSYDVERNGIYGIIFRDSDTDIRYMADASGVAANVAAKKLELDEATKRATRPLSWVSTNSWKEEHAELVDLLKMAIKADVEVGIGVDRRLYVAKSDDQKDIQARIWANEDAVTAYLQHDRQSELNAADRAAAGLKVAMADLHEEVTECGTWPEICARLKAKCQEELERRTRHRDVRTTLSQLPQLFIAT